MSVIEQLRRLVDGIHDILRNQPCNDNCGGLFFPRYDPDGAYVGEEYIDPQAYAGGLIQTLQDIAGSLDLPAILAKLEAVVEKCKLFIHQAHHQDKCNVRHFRSCTCGKSELEYQFSQLIALAALEGGQQ